jgi:hypothetical protein
VKIIERIPAHYEDQEVEDLGQVYRRRPEQVVLECGICGTRTTCKRSNLLTSIVAVNAGREVPRTSGRSCSTSRELRTNACIPGATCIRKKVPEYPVYRGLERRSRG